MITFKQFVVENITPKTIHKLADSKGVKWDNEPSFLKLTKRLTGKKHLDDLDQAGLQKVKDHLNNLSEQTEYLQSLVDTDQSERDEYDKFVKLNASGNYTKGAKLYAKSKNRRSDDIFGERERLDNFIKTKFKFEKFSDNDWNNHFILTQHSDHNREFQRQMLDVIRRYKGEDHENYRYLHDRINCAETGKQQYNTQSICQKD